jgi:hypothetical protein
MTETELDHVYTEFCRALERAGREGKEAFLARFALLCMVAIDDRERLQQLIHESEASQDDDR